MPNEGGRREGYLVVADIAGYTAFFTGTELEHAQGILEELTTLIKNDLAPPLRFVKLEGDAILCCADGSKFADGERLLELLEVCYRDFSDRLFDMARAATCPCAACASMDSLDLKFVSHYGAYMVQRVEGVEDIAGPDVILDHRLLKNSITDRTGCRAYAFFTEACLERLPASLNLAKHTETYESLGETTGGVHDLKPVLEQMHEERREYVGADEADFEWTFAVPVPQAVLWQYWVDPDKRLKWQTMQTAIDNKPNSRGRLGVGAASHCAHGGDYDFLRHYVDWRPFKYFTCRGESTKRSFQNPRSFTYTAVTETTEFLPRQGGGTVFHHRIRFQNRGRLFQLLMRLMGALRARRTVRSMEANLTRLLEEDGWLDGAADRQPLKRLSSRRA